MTEPAPGAAPGPIAGRPGPRVSFIIVGLGNPGGEYTATRHNIGFTVVDRVAARLRADIRRTEFRALTAEAMLGGSMVLLMKPQTFMNRSGSSAAAALESHGLPPERLLALYDDLDLPLGRLRIRAQGGAGGHRGVASLIEHLGTQAFPRLRIGVGRPPEGTEVIDHVLAPFSASEAAELENTIDRAASAIDCIVTNGLVEAMETFNR